MSPGSLKQMLLSSGVALVMAACGGDGGNGTDGGGDGGRDYPPEIVDQFISSCTQGGTSRAVCQCALDRFEDKYTIDEFEEESVKLAEGEPSEEFARDLFSFSAQCQEQEG